MVYRKKQFVTPTPFFHDGSWRYKWNGKPETIGPGKPGQPMSEELNHRWRLICLKLKQDLDCRLMGFEPLPDEYDLTISEGVLIYLKFLETHRHPIGALRPDGTLSSFYRKASQCLQPLVVNFGPTLARDYTAADLDTLREALLTGEWVGVQGIERNKKRVYCVPWSIDYSNNAVYHIQKFFAWLERKNHIPPGTHHHLETVGRLTENEPTERQVVPDEELLAVAEQSSPIVRAMLLLQRLTACRPSEICIMRPQDIRYETIKYEGSDGEVLEKKEWIYRPAKHKMRYKKKLRAIVLTASAMGILKPFLSGKAPEDYLFTGQESAQYWREHRSERPRATPRKTKIYPCEIRRREKAKLARARRSDSRKFNAHFTADTYCQAVQYAQEKARAAGQTIGDWTPYNIRHTRITEVQEAEGTEAAQAVGGQTSINIVALYAHRQLQRAVKLAADSSEPQAIRDYLQGAETGDLNTGQKNDPPHAQG